MAITSVQSLQRNVTAREEAERHFSKAKQFVDEDKLNLSPKRFWETLAVSTAQEAGLIVLPNDKRHLMDDIELQEFLCTEVPYGIYAGKTVKEVNERDPDYWSAITESRFARDLEKYLRTVRQKRLGAGFDHRA